MRETHYLKHILLKLLTNSHDLWSTTEHPETQIFQGVDCILQVTKLPQSKQYSTVKI